jgi:hypothetical protein
MVPVYPRGVSQVRDDSSSSMAWQTIVDEMVDEFCIQAKGVRRVTQRLVAEKDGRYFMMLRKAAIALKAGGVSGRAFVRFICTDHQRRSRGRFPFVEQVFGPRAVEGYTAKYLRNAPNVRVAPTLKLPAGATARIRAWESECKALRRAEVDEWEKTYGVAKHKAARLAELVVERTRRHAGR